MATSLTQRWQQHLQVFLHTLYWKRFKPPQVTLLSVQTILFEKGRDRVCAPSYANTNHGTAECSYPVQVLVAHKAAMAVAQAIICVINHKAAVLGLIITF